MRFVISWELTETRSDADQARIIALFSKWQPPVELSEWSGFVDGDGGFAIAEASDANTLAQITAPWTPWLRFSIRPIQPIQQTAESMQEAIEFRHSVS